VPHSDFNELWPVATTHYRDKNPERIWAPTASLKSDARFTEFLTLSQVFAGKTKQWHLDLKFCPHISSMILKIS
jgi:hypothetical protein